MLTLNAHAYLKRRLGYEFEANDPNTLPYNISLAVTVVEYLAVLRYPIHSALLCRLILGHGFA